MVPIAPGTKSGGQEVENSPGAAAETGSFALEKPHCGISLSSMTFTCLSSTERKIATNRGKIATKMGNYYF